MENNSTPEELSRFWLIISNMVPPVGLFLYLRNREQHPIKAKKALTSALIGIPIALIGGYVFNTYILW